MPPPPSIASLADLDVAEKRVLVRADLGMSSHAPFEVTDHWLRALLPTLRHLLERDVRILLATHVPSPDAEPGHAPSVEPAAAKLSELLERDVYLPDDCLSDAARKVVGDLRAGEICVLENLARHAGEMSADAGFAQRLAEYCDVYVADAPSALTLELASTTGLPKFVRDRGMGLLLRHELDAFQAFRNRARAGFNLLLGGSDVSRELSTLSQLPPRCAKLILLGELAVTIQAAKRDDKAMTGVTTTELAQARTLLQKLERDNTELLLPVDAVLEDGATVSLQELASLHQERPPFDLGPESRSRIKRELYLSETVLWHGLPGRNIAAKDSKGLELLARTLSESQAFSVVIGAEAPRALGMLDAELTNRINCVSTAGSAVWTLLQGGPLPALVPLRGSKSVEFPNP